MMMCVFEEQIGRQVEVYADYLLVKSKHANQYPQHLVEVLNMLCN